MDTAADGDDAGRGLSEPLQTLFCGLLHESGAIGNLIADAWLTALAIERGCEWISDDVDFACCPRPRGRQPA